MTDSTGLRTPPAERPPSVLVTAASAARVTPGGLTPPGPTALTPFTAAAAQGTPSIWPLRRAAAPQITAGADTRVLFILGGAKARPPREDNTDVYTHAAAWAQT